MSPTGVELRVTEDMVQGALDNELLDPSQGNNTATVPARP
ncbi:hypothetical protein J2T34_002592 [Kerstersia gyiorum]|nr:hypothetical protein [Kerstersia gyiorum]MCP1710212.1 hypothetical protein [Kerstersia gyiorum]